MYLTCVKDIYSRKRLSRWISNALDASFCVDATTEGVRLTGSPEIIPTDRGYLLPPGAFVTAVTASGARISMDGKWAGIDNISIQPFWRSLKVEEVTLRAYDGVADTKRWIKRSIDRVNTIRPHASLGG